MARMAASRRLPASGFGGVQAAGFAPRPRAARGFTLIELMIVMGIMAIVMAMGAPAIYRVWNREPIRQAAADLQEVCSNARARAILGGTMTEVVFHPNAGHFEVAGAAAPAGGSGSAPTAPGVAVSLSGTGLSGQLSEHVAFEMLDVNQLEYRDKEIARVRFYPNGTCDELTVVLLSDKGERRLLRTELTTGLVSVETDPRRF
jgi:prepilin-type N-terminal cleavage/methylation domain-containing protein